MNFHRYAGRACGNVFVQARCPSCGKIVGLYERDDVYKANPKARVFCSTICANAVPCSIDLWVQIREAKP